MGISLGYGIRAHSVNGNHQDGWTRIYVLRPGQRTEKERHENGYDSRQSVMGRKQQRLL